MYLFERRCWMDVRELYEEKDPTPKEMIEFYRRQFQARVWAGRQLK